MAINKNTNDILERVRKKQILTADLLQKPLKKICKKQTKKLKKGNLYQLNGHCNNDKVFC